MKFLKGAEWVLGMTAMLALAVSGCFNFADEDDPLINPNLEATLTTGTTSGPGSGIGTPGTGVLTISPTAVRLPINETMTFTAAGGEPPYTFTIVTVPAYGLITSDGIYSAGNSTGTERIRVTDNAGARSDSEVTLYDPASDPRPYRIVCTDVSPPASAITVYKGPPGSPRIVNFRIENGIAPDTFNVTNQSGGSPKGYIVGTREGKWEVGTTGSDTGSVCDTLQVFDSSSPINVSSLKIYVCNTNLQISPTFAVVPSSGTQQFTTTATGVGTLFWSIPVNQTQGTISATGLYDPGSNTRGVIGAADVVQVRDSFSPVAQVSQAKVSVPGLSVYPAKVSMRPSTSQAFIALGGSGNYQWTRTSNRSNNTQSFPMSGTSITYNSGNLEGLDVLTLSDGTTGGTLTIPITVCAAVSSRSFQAVTGYFPASGTITDLSYDVVVDDFNKDGVHDVAVPVTCSNQSPFPIGDLQGTQVGVLMGSTTPGSFASAATKFALPTGAVGPYAITTGDYNADGNRDIAVACYTSGHAVVMYGDGSGGFPNTGGTSGLSYTVLTVGSGTGPTGITTYNFDRANGDDLVVCDGLGGGVYVYLSNGGGPGAAPGGFTLVSQLACTDPNPADSILPKCMDVAVANFNNDTNGPGRTGNGPDGNGWVDIAVTDYNHDYVVFFPATGLTAWSDSSQVARVVYNGTGGTSVRKPARLAVGNFNGDGYPDVAVTCNGVSVTSAVQGVSVFFNSGTAGAFNFATPVEIAPQYVYYDYYACYFWGITADDLDNDGIDDIAVTSRAVRQDPATYYSTYYANAILVWRCLAGNTIYGFGRTDAYASIYRIAGSPYYWAPTGIAAIDFGGVTHGTPGAPMPDLVVSNACFQNQYAYYGKLVVFENRSN